MRKLLQQCSGLEYVFGYFFNTKIRYLGLLLSELGRIKTLNTCIIDYEQEANHEVDDSVALRSSYLKTAFQRLEIALTLG